ncbi:MAG: VOC family protein [Micropruina sp.]|nr:VOC family protein [Micropruina sp.]
MGISVLPYLNFAGNTREAMTYYQGIFGGTLSISSFADFGMEGMPADGTMHSELVHELFTVMATDAMPGAEATWNGTRNYICFIGDQPEQMIGWYDALAAEGTTDQPLEKQVWGDMFGVVKDKFGIEWMFNIALPEGWAQTQAPA